MGHHHKISGQRVPHPKAIHSRSKKTGDEGSRLHDDDSSLSSTSSEEEEPGPAAAPS